MDDISLGALFIALVVILICSAFFSASETSMMALNRLRLNHLVRKGNKSAKLTAKLLSKTDQLLGSILFGNTLLNAAAASLTGIIILRMFGANDLVLLLGTLAISFVIVIFSEIMPKVIAASHPERIALFASYILAPLNKVFYPAVSIATAIVRGFLWLLRIKVQADQSKQKVSLEEVRMLVLEAEHFLPRKHQKMLLNLVDIERIAVNDVMIPRNQIEALDINAPSDLLREQLATCHHTILPVYENELDNIIGTLHVRRVLSLMQREAFSSAELREVLQEAYFIPSDTSLLSQLQHFQERHLRLGLIVDEYGELLGLVTLENIMEEIVGDFTTESPAKTGKFMRQQDGSMFVEGGTLLRDLNRKMGMHFPLDGAKTLNGLILEHLQDIPEAGTSLKISGYPIEIIQTQDRVVKVARIVIAPATKVLH
ncbi:MAG: magnesium and cobalt efflux protein CorC [Gallionellales bacterium 35-53-114]|nr:MAG: magnesium and cobalt efflux protein CorC [Gallionellales bacterium 35-53-114]OYZ63878.1 MAG: magnesium and cobalt efflux protein CorC [Gallionellales bacterium 24-53-125]OZB09291.1 MAG: magnesium and cobalt efflux protein CorC [Gallionellales bacterium 39-52-133]HQS59096.1 HlyC/CorC family transporter [Gallionellaceae bacterium]HQS75832.1 HlyC/CorC family transporter [Gallionellaceae bacterium]